MERMERGKKKGRDGLHVTGQEQDAWPAAQAPGSMVKRGQKHPVLKSAGLIDDPAMARPARTRKEQRRGRRKRRGSTGAEPWRGLGGGLNERAGQR